MFELLSNTRIQKIENLVQKVKIQILEENPFIADLLYQSNSKKDFISKLHFFLIKELRKNKEAYFFYQNHPSGKRELSDHNIALIRLLDYIDNNNLKIIDLNLKSNQISSHPLEILYDYLKFENSIVAIDFAFDFLFLFRQYNHKNKTIKPSKEQFLNWMNAHPSGLDKEIILERKKNKSRIINLLIKKIDKGEIKNKKYSWTKETTFSTKLSLVNKWWNEKTFHLQFAVRNPDLLNEFLDHSLDKNTMNTLHRAANKGIPFFVNLHYLSLLSTNSNTTDATLKQYVLYSQELIDEFGEIKAWEKEDIVKTGEPNAAGWLLPSHDSVHRRYPEVAILIPATMGRACAGLCVSCQRMYDFQRGHLNFNLDKLSPTDTWPKRLKRYLDYFKNDSYLRDILITGGDAFMSSDMSLKFILDSVYKMAKEKKEENKNRPNGEKHAEMLRVRLGTRILAYLPQRVTPELVQVLSDFRNKAIEIGIKQFVIQTHFESAMEISPESKLAIERISKAGWLITNQLVLTSAASVRGHTSKLRKVLNDLGVISYYTFSVKGFSENKVNFATNARAMQEMEEEKCFGLFPDEFNEKISRLSNNAINIKQEIKKIREQAQIPFLATDKTVLNLPGVGKSMTYRVIGLTDDGRRILRFKHDDNRQHSPIIKKMGEVDIIESKSIYAYLLQLKQFGEEIDDYLSIWNYSYGYTEKRSAIFEYPEYPFELTKVMTNIQI